VTRNVKAWHLHSNLFFLNDLHWTSKWQAQPQNGTRMALESLDVAVTCDKQLRLSRVALVRKLMEKGRNKGAKLRVQLIKNSGIFSPESTIP
jgi:hypothetical protein